MKKFINAILQFGSQTKCSRLYDKCNIVMIRIYREYNYNWLNHLRTAFIIVVRKNRIETSS